MKRSLIISAAALLLITVVAFVDGGGETYKTLSIGDKAPKVDVKMKDISGKSVSLEDVAKDNGLLVVFSCNTCPFVIKWEDRYPGLGDLCEKNNIGMVLVNSNEAKRDNADSFDNMVAHADEKGYNCMYVVDEKSEVANSFGAKTTPHVFLFNNKMKLVYKGAIDDNLEDASAVKEKYLESAIGKMVNGEKIDPTKTKAIGCSIKRV